MLCLVRTLFSIRQQHRCQYTFVGVQLEYKYLDAAEVLLAPLKQGCLSGL